MSERQLYFFEPGSLQGRWADEQGEVFDIEQDGDTFDELMCFLFSAVEGLHQNTVSRTSAIALPDHYQLIAEYDIHWPETVVEISFVAFFSKLGPANKAFRQIENLIESTKESGLQERGLDYGDIISVMLCESTGAEIGGEIEQSLSIWL